MFTIYAIKSIKHNYIYVGLTNNLARRLDQHNNARARSTKPYALFQLIYAEESSGRILARKREKFLKNGSGKEFLKSLDTNN